MAEASWLDPDVHQILSQMLMAFAQGAGTLMASREMIAAATADYAERVAREKGRWDAIALQTLEFARGLGRVAAHHAVRDGRNLITEHDYRRASEQMGQPKLRMAVYQDCPFC